MSHSNEAEDYKIFSVETSQKFLENDDNIIKFSEDSKLEQKQTKNFKEVTYSFFKRALDITASSVALLVFSPVLLVTSIAIKRDSSGPVMFKQQRIGKDGKLFEIYKFRTMVEKADEKLFELLEKDEVAKEEYQLNKKLKNDPRVTKVGNFLRRTSIDELPQLINVLKGEMSLVGPRPYLPREMDDIAGYYDSIIETKPGITGLWQVSGRSNTTFEERLIYDKEYIENQGFLYDINLLTKTIGVVINKNGAE